LDDLFLYREEVAGIARPTRRSGGGGSGRERVLFSQSAFRAEPRHDTVGMTSSCTGKRFRITYGAEEGK
jgi:hypothetical protein